MTGTVRTPKTAELIAAGLRGRIVRGELRPGDNLPSEAGLMAEFGVSRPTLREAFRILETEALIAVRRGARGGAHVLTPDPTVAARHVGLLLQVSGTTVADVQEARTVVEAACAGRLARRRTDRDLADLRECLGCIQALAAAGVPDPAAWERATRRFHDLVLQRSGNRTLAVQGRVLQDIAAADRVVSVRRGRQVRDPAPCVRVFETLVDLVAAGDAAGAEAHWRAALAAATRAERVVDLFA